MDVTELALRTGDRLVTDVTSSVAEFCAGRGDGLLTVFVPHATAGVAVMETGSGSEQDLAEAVDRLLPRGSGYRHSHGSPSAAWCCPSSPADLVCPIGDRPPLPTWWLSVSALT